VIIENFLAQSTKAHTLDFMPPRIDERRSLTIVANIVVSSTSSNSDEGTLKMLLLSLIKVCHSVSLMR